MKKNNIGRNIILLISPFLFMILINEISRPNKILKDSQKVYGVKTMNPISKKSTECSWYCFFDTTYCKRNHVKFMKPYFKYIDSFYYGQIKFLHSFGNYAVANIIFMVILWPLTMYLLLIWSLNLKQRIKNYHG